MPPFARMSYAKSKDFKKAMRFLFKGLKAYRVAVAISLFLAAAATVISIMGPYILNYMMEEVLRIPMNFDQITKYGIMKMIFCLIF